MGDLKGAALFVKHRDEWKCVGRVYPTELVELGYKGMIFEHVHTDTQTHYDTRGPGGLDLEVIGFLISRGIRYVVDCEIESMTAGKTGQKKRTWSYITLDRLLEVGQKATYDGRTRIFIGYKDLRLLSKRFKRPAPNLPELHLYTHEAEPAVAFFSKKLQQGTLLDLDPVNGKVASAGA